MVSTMGVAENDDSETCDNIFQYDENDDLRAGD